MTTHVDASAFAAQQVVPVEPPIQHDRAALPELIQATQLVRAAEARNTFTVDGARATVAVLDTGVRATHVDFAGRVVAQRNFTADNNGDRENASDGNGHGTNVSGIVCAGDIHTGMAPRAKLVALKVLANSGGGSFEQIRDALQWVLDNRARHGISVVSMSLGASDNRDTDADLGGDVIGALLRQLTEAGVACCVAAGNDYFAFGSAQGMSYPAIFRETLSVGAVYDADEGGFSYQSGAKAISTAADRITPFSQRLHRKVGGDCETDIFAPGAPITSSGINNDRGESIQHGTSQATPVIAGIVALLQDFCVRVTGTLPAVGEIRDWLVRSAVDIIDGDDEQDNVQHSGLRYRRVDAMAALTACAKDLARRQLADAGDRTVVA
ncbi:subtilisin family serine protease [Nocardia transvalensis]|uniref:Subtilisin family serine protease n=1 Tax=Nocardia transvalensis TaxID=37333 RepID=A0A7W9P8D0_9NOCA|nr:S8 family serine peptidase [Nocardia transvalensis]MBB5911230.1 subtilisin family serine protease [Nocardia transvalensis]